MWQSFAPIARARQYASPTRRTQGLWHLAFAVGNVSDWSAPLQDQSIAVEPICMGEATQKQVRFFVDPDGPLIGLNESRASKPQLHRF